MAPKGKDKGGKGKKDKEPPPDITPVDRPNVIDTLFPEWNESTIAGDKVDGKGTLRGWVGLVHICRRLADYLIGDGLMGGGGVAAVATQP